MRTYRLTSFGFEDMLERRFRGFNAKQAAAQIWPDASRTTAATRRQKDMFLDLKDHMLGLTRSLAGWCTKQESFMLVFYCESPVFLGLLSWGKAPRLPY